eukprot:Hpha_TRINITY_DN21306_c0_g1::TRINITY_DN21306_c0_g1_i1::g.192618::m.192618
MDGLHHCYCCGAKCAYQGYNETGDSIADGERRLDFDDGQMYSYAEFLHYYGPTRGQLNWRASGETFLEEQGVDSVCEECGPTFKHTYQFLRPEGQLSNDGSGSTGGVCIRPGGCGQGRPTLEGMCLPCWKLQKAKIDRLIGPLNEPCYLCGAADVPRKLQDWEYVCAECSKWWQRGKQVLRRGGGGADGW